MVPYAVMMTTGIDGIEFPDAAQQLDAVHAGKPHVGEHDVGAEALQQPSACSASAATSASYPASIRNAFTARARVRSSSTISTVPLMPCLRPAAETRTVVPEPGG